MLCTQAAPFFAIFSQYLHRYHLHQTAVNRLKNEQLVCVELSHEQAKGVKEGSEIQIDGKTMDVKTAICLPDKVLVYGWYDEAEDELKYKLASLMNQQQNEEDDTHFLKKVWQLFVLYFPYQQVNLQENLSRNNSASFLSFSANLTTVHLPVATPPPLYG